MNASGSSYSGFVPLEVQLYCVQVLNHLRCKAVDFPVYPEECHLYAYFRLIGNPVLHAGSRIYVKVFQGLGFSAGFNR